MLDGIVLSELDGIARWRRTVLEHEDVLWLRIWPHQLLEIRSILAFYQFIAPNVAIWVGRPHSIDGELQPHVFSVCSQRVCPIQFWKTIVGDWNASVASNPNFEGSSVDFVSSLGLNKDVECVILFRNDVM